MSFVKTKESMKIRIFLRFLSKILEMIAYLIFIHINFNQIYSFLYLLLLFLMNIFLVKLSNEHNNFLNLAEIINLMIHYLHKLLYLKICEYLFSFIFFYLRQIYYSFIKINFIFIQFFNLFFLVNFIMVPSYF